MRKHICAFAVIRLVSASITFLGSCSTEDDYLYPEETYLDINNQIPRKRNTSGETLGTNPETGWGKIPVNEDECALYALTSLKHDTDLGWYNANTKATDYYYRMYDYAAKNHNYKGGSMKYPTILAVGKQFNLINGMESFASGTNEALMYFNTNANSGKIKMVNLENHTAKFESYNQRKQKVTYSDSKGTHTRPVTVIKSVFYK